MSKMSVEDRKLVTTLRRMALEGKSLKQMIAFLSDIGQNVGSAPLLFYYFGTAFNFSTVLQKRVSYFPLMDEERQQIIEQAARIELEQTKEDWSSL